MSQDALETSEIKRRSLSGAKWLLLTNGFGLPAVYLITFFLGRTGPDALGAYALAQIFIGVIITFALFGGPTVLRNFMPKIGSPSDRGRFLYTYGAMVGALVAVVLVIFYAFPGLLAFLLHREFSRENYLWFVILTVFVVLAECLMGAAAGLMHIKLAAIARLMSRIVILPMVGLLFVYNRPMLAEYATELILLGFLVAYGVSAGICVVGLARDPRFKCCSGVHLPPGFGPFTLTSAAAVVFTFVAENFDRMVVLSISDLEGLGKYQATVSLAMLVAYLPRMISTGLVPMFSSLLASGRNASIVRGYDLVQRVGTLSIAVVSLVMIAFGREMLGLFGEAYVEYDYLLAIFCLQSVLTSLFLGNTAILTSLERNAFRLGASFLQVFIQIAGTMAMLDAWGVFAIAAAKSGGAIVSQGLSTIYVVYGIRGGFRIPHSYWASVGIAVGLAVTRTQWLPPGWLISGACAVSALALLWFFSGLSVAECKKLLAILIKPARLKE